MTIQKRKQKLHSSAVAASVAKTIKKAGKSMTSMLDLENPVAFKRSLADAQEDESNRLEAIREEEIDPYYLLVEIARSKVSAQFLNTGEPVTSENRETLLRIHYGDYNTNVEIAGQDGEPLGTLFMMEDSKVYIADFDYDGYKILLVTLPEYDVIEGYVFDASFGRYTFVFSEPLSATAKAA